MDVEIHNLNCIVRTPDLDRLATIEKWFAVRMQNWWRTPLARSRRGWDGYYRFFRPDSNKLETGLLPLLLDKLKEHQWRYTLTDRREAPLLSSEKLSLEGIALHPHQIQAVKRVLENKLGDFWFPRGIIWLPTATGKTEIIAALCKQVRTRCLVLVHKKDLLVQTAERIAMRIREPVGMIGDGVLELSPRIGVAMVQTLSRHLVEFAPYLKHTGMFISDESHHLGAAQTFRKVAQVCPAYVRVALSATPFDKDNPVQQFRLVGQTSTVLYHESPQQMADQDVVAKVRVHAVPLSTPKTVNGQDAWSLPYASAATQVMVGKVTVGAYEALIVENERRNNIIINWVSRHLGPTLVIVSRLEHGRLLQQGIKEKIKEEVPFLWGNEPTAYRQEALRGLGAGKIRVVIATIADEGVDVPAIQHLILAAGGKSEIRFLQRVGRGMRKKAGDQMCHVLDFLDGTNEFLLEHSRARIWAAQQAGFEVVVEKKWGDTS